MAALSRAAAFVGLGMMGGPMAARLASLSRKTDSALGAFPVLVWNRTPGKALAHASQHGTIPVPDLRALAEGDAQTIFLCVSTSADVEAILKEMGPSLAPGKTVVDCTSGDPMLSLQIAEDLRARDVHYLDCPVSGGVGGATNGTLTAMVGGPGKVLEQCRPLIAAFATKIVHAGDRSGSGMALKAINNSLNACHLLVAAEGLLALKKWGISPDIALEAINGSSGRSLATTHRMPEHILTRKFAHGFALALMDKDLQIGSSIMKSLFPEALILKTAISTFHEALGSQGPDVDYTQAVRYLETLAGTTLEANQKTKDE